MHSSCTIMHASPAPGLVASPPPFRARTVAAPSSASAVAVGSKFSVMALIKDAWVLLGRGRSCGGGEVRGLGGSEGGSEGESKSDIGNLQHAPKPQPQSPHGTCSPAHDPTCHASTPHTPSPAPPIDLPRTRPTSLLATTQAPCATTPPCPLLVLRCVHRAVWDIAQLPPSQ